jgi:hypothetical protein
MSASGVMGLRRRKRASRGRACDRRPLSTASGTAISQARAGGGFVADRMTGVVWLSSGELLLGSAGGRWPMMATAGELMRRTRHAACIHGCRPDQPAGARGRQRSRRPDGRWRAACAPEDVGARAAAWSASGRWQIMGYSGRADAARAARGLYQRLRARSARRRAGAPAHPPTGWSLAFLLALWRMSAPEQQLGAPVVDGK